MLIVSCLVLRPWVLFGKDQHFFVFRPWSAHHTYQKLSTPGKHEPVRKANPSELQTTSIVAITRVHTTQNSSLLETSEGWFFLYPLFLLFLFVLFQNLLSIRMITFSVTSENSSTLNWAFRDNSRHFFLEVQFKKTVY